LQHGQRKFWLQHQQNFHQNNKAWWGKTEGCKAKIAIVETELGIYDEPLALEITAIFGIFSIFYYVQHSFAKAKNYQK